MPYWRRLLRRAPALTRVALNRLDRLQTASALLGRAIHGIPQSVMAGPLPDFGFHGLTAKALGRGDAVVAVHQEQADLRSEDDDWWELIQDGGVPLDPLGVEVTGRGQSRLPQEIIDPDGGHTPIVPALGGARICVPRRRLRPTMPRSGRPLMPRTVAYLARFTGLSREHTDSDLRAFLCTDRAIEPLRAERRHLELSVRWMQETRRSKPSTVSRRTSVLAGFYGTCVIDGAPPASSRTFAMSSSPRSATTSVAPTSTTRSLLRRTRAAPPAHARDLGPAGGQQLTGP